MPEAIARLNFQSDMNWGYIEGFRRAADIVAKQIIEENQNPDYLIYPLGFLYHQHLELQLKWLIDLASLLLNESKPTHLTHNLTELWQILQPKLLLLEPNGEQYVKELGDLIADVCITDHSGEQFRYQLRKGGQASLQTISHIQVEEFALKRMAISDRLQAIRDALSVRKDQLAECMFWSNEHAIGDEGRL